MGRDEVLKAIRQAEKKARGILKDADSKAAEILSKARLRSAEIIQSSKSDSEAASQNLITKSRSIAEGEAAKVSEEGDSAIGSIHDAGHESRVRAVKAVIDAFKS